MGKQLILILAMIFALSGTACKEMGDEAGGSNHSGENGSSDSDDDEDEDDFEEDEDYAVTYLAAPIASVVCEEGGSGDICVPDSLTLNLEPLTLSELELEGTTNDIAAGLERMALDSDQGIRPRATAASRLLELTGVDPGCANAFNVPELPADPLPEPCKRMKA